MMPNLTFRCPEELQLEVKDLAREVSEGGLNLPIGLDVTPADLYRTFIRDGVAELRAKLAETRKTKKTAAAEDKKPSGAAQ